MAKETEAQRNRRLLIRKGLVIGIPFMVIPLLFLLTTTLAGAQTFPENELAIRFYGHGIDDIDRVKIPLIPDVPVNVGSTDFTIEFWMRAAPGDNQSNSCGTFNDAWITGNIIFDRDVWGPGDFGDYGISLTDGRIAFGVSVADNGRTVCSETRLDDNEWHHIAVTRRHSDGLLRVYVDGLLEGQVDGPNGDAHYNINRQGQPDDPYLVIGAEKHDAGPEFPSFNGWLDEVRISDILRYTQDFPRPDAPFTADANAAAIYHFDEGQVGACFQTIVDISGASGGPSNGTCNFGGGSPSGPVYVLSDAPISSPTAVSLTRLQGRSSSGAPLVFVPLGIILLAVVTTTLGIFRLAAKKNNP